MAGQSQWVELFVTLLWTTTISIRTSVAATFTSQDASVCRSLNAQYQRMHHLRSSAFTVTALLVSLLSLCLHVGRVEQSAHGPALARTDT